jgi:hypothetical protein
MNRDEIARIRIQNIIKNHDSHDFPSFILLTRHIYGINRRTACYELGLGENRLFFLENGRFKRLPNDAELECLAVYYELPLTLLQQKAKKFLEDGKGKPQWQK